MEWIKKWVRFACETYTVTAMLLLFFSIALSDGGIDKGISVRAFLFVFAFAAMFALAQLQFFYATLSKTFRVILHFILTVLAAFLFLYLPNNPASSGAGKLMMLLILTVVYWILMGVFLIFSKKQHNMAKQDSSYQNVYKKN